MTNYLEILNKSRLIAINNLPDEARSILREIGSVFDLSKPGDITDDNIKKILSFLYFTLLPGLSKERIYDFLSILLNYILLTPEIDYGEINERFKLRISMMLADEEEDFRSSAALFLTANKGLITSKNINTYEGEVVGTIDNWLKDFLYYLNNAKFGFKHSITSYLTENKNCKIISKAEWLAVQKLINLFVLITDSPYSLASSTIVDTQIKTDNGQIKILSSAKIIDVTTGFRGKEIERKSNIQSSKESSVDISLVLNNFINANFFSDVLVAKSRMAGGSWSEVRSHFYQAVNEGKAAEAAAALLLIAESGGLKEAFAGDERFVKFWGDYLAKNMPADTGEFVKDPANPKDLARFLQYILEGRLKMKGDEAAMVGVLIANSARLAGDLNYKTLAYGDMESGEFRWNV
ncbi:hypothetical protein GYA13_03615 [Candidatus Kuenenbacteria bacterium]|nr:hypothetical protein [Candidatus Kuenenbacteria bacterium]